MKPILILFSLLMLVCCRSTKQEELSVNDDLQQQTELEYQRDTYSQSNRVRNDSVTDISNEVRYLEVTNFRPDGTISCILKKWTGKSSKKKSGIAEKTESSSQTKENLKVTRKTIRKTEMNQLKKTKTDNRLIQGSEWFWLIPSIVFTITIVIFIYKKPKK